jgi:hypothetical protein
MPKPGGAVLEPIREPALMASPSETGVGKAPERGVLAQKYAD